jgi:methylenetetrahydrofolate dehydrogenase (NADP+)/methenyltetrahydrofolate cyclohydrolase
MAQIDGKKIAQDILTQFKTRPVPRKSLVAILVGDNAASESFVKQKAKIATGLGVDFRIHRFPNDISHEALYDALQKIADDPTCGGLILQLPLPDRRVEQDILDSIPREKDVDVLGASALTAFHNGESDVLPPVVGTVLAVLNSYFPTPIATFQFLVTASVAVVGVGRLVGQPIAAWLKGKAKEIVVIDEGDDLKKIARADLIVTGAGVPGLITAGMLKANALVVDFGYGTKNGKVMGDFDPSPAGVISYTPTPGGTGPILVAKLFENFYTLNRSR